MTRSHQGQTCSTEIHNLVTRHDRFGVGVAYDIQSTISAKSIWLTLAEFKLNGRLEEQRALEFLGGEVRYLPMTDLNNFQEPYPKLVCALSTVRSHT